MIKKKSFDLSIQKELTTEFLTSFRKRMTHYYLSGTWSVKSRMKEPVPLLQRSSEKRQVL